MTKSRFRAAALAALMATPAAGQNLMPINCGTAAKAEDEIAHLNRVYDEVPVYTAITDGDEPSIMVLMASPSGTFSLLLVLPSGRACYLATGEEIQPWPMGDRG